MVIYNFKGSVLHKLCSNHPLCSNQRA